jgi:hypothetical protein
MVASTSAGNTRLLVVGGIVFALLAVALIAGMSIVLWTMFAPRTARPAAVPAVEPPPFVAAVPPPVTPAAPAVVTPTASAPAPSPTVPVIESDIADVRKPDAPPAAPPPTPLAERKGPERASPVEAPVIPVKIVGAGVTGVDQARIDAAIANGVAYLKKQQAGNGTWGGGPIIGYTALAGLTLLECKVPAADPHVLKAAGYVRNNCANLMTTYELSLAILFLDRLGNPKDKAIIQGMALRLLAGQNEAGGWTYASHVHLTPPEMHQLLLFLKSHRPPAPPAKAIHVPAEPGKQVALPDMPGKQVQGKPDDDPFKQLADLLKPAKVLQDPSSPRPSAGEGGVKGDPKNDKPVEGQVKKPADKPGTPPGKKPEDKPDPTAAAKKVTPININTLPARVQKLPIVRVNAEKGKLQPARTRPGDNSNTQFALMGLWAARRHDVPTEYALELAMKRFVDSQDKNDGGWGYLMIHPTKNTMTCVGLIGLAMGHGVNADVGKDKAKLGDPAIQKGLAALGQFIGVPSMDPIPLPAMENLYFLWSVERVAMLYDLKTIGGKDWYGWGAQTLLPNQHADGSWTGGKYHGSAAHTDTCFALLFLKRSNLVPDLTENLRLYMVIRDPEAK